MRLTGTVPLRSGVRACPAAWVTSRTTALGATCGIVTVVGGVRRRFGAWPLTPTIAYEPAAVYWHSTAGPRRTWAGIVPQSIWGATGVPSQVTGTPTAAPRWMRAPVLKVSGGYTVMLVLPPSSRPVEVVVVTV